MLAQGRQPAVNVSKEVRMSLPSFRTFGIAAVALLGLSLAPGRAAAEQGWPLNPENRGGNSYSPGYYRYSVPTYRISSPAMVTVAAPAGTPIRVQVPAQALVWFDSVLTTQTGPVRDFLAPPLTPGHEYRYTVRATWHEGGRQIERQQIVSFTAGDLVTIDFTTTMVSVTH
jgi:uncharacterized protein (TIGR03000 family)